MSAHYHKRYRRRVRFNFERLFDFRTAEQRGVAVARYSAEFREFQMRSAALRANPFDVMRAALERKAEG